MTQVAANPREHIGANNPPPDEITFQPTQEQLDRLALDAKCKRELREAILFAFETYKLASEFTREHPSIGAGQLETAQQAKRYNDQLRADEKNIEAKRSAVVKPFNDHVKAINTNTKLATDPIGKLIENFDKLETAYQKAERTERERIAAEAERAATEARRIAEEALRLEQEALAAPDTGEFVDVGAAIVEANHAVFNDRRAANQAAIAARDAANVTIKTNTGRSRNLRTYKTFQITDIDKAVNTMIRKSPEIPVKLTEMLITWATNYERQYQIVPEGFRMETEERI